MEDFGTRYIVTRRAFGQAPCKVKFEGLPANATGTISDNGACVAWFSSNGLSGWFSRQSRPYRKIRVRMRGDDQATVCLTFVTGSVAEAARELREGGQPKKALELLEMAGVPDGAARIEALLASVKCGERAEESWISAASEAIALCESISAPCDPAAELSLCGTPARYAEDFANARISGLSLSPGFRLPVWLPRGEYDIIWTCRPEAGAEIFAEMFPHGAIVGMAAGHDDENRLQCRMRISLAEDFMPSCPGLPGDESFKAFQCDLEIKWSPTRNAISEVANIRSAVDAAHRSGGRDQ